MMQNILRCNICYSAAIQFKISFSRCPLFCVAQQRRKWILHVLRELADVTPVSLPLRDLSRSAQQMKHFFDVIYDHAGSISYDALAPILRHQAWSELPPPFGLKRDLGVNYLMQLFVIPQNDGQHCIVKHIFIPDHKVKASLILEAGYGTMQEIVRGNNAKNTKKALQFMLEQLGGVQFRILPSPPRSRKLPKASQRNPKRTWTKASSTFASTASGIRAT